MKETITAKNKVDTLFDQYAQSHQNPINKLIHWICIPLIMFGLLGLVWQIPFPQLAFLGRYQTFFNWASFLIAFVLYYYFTLSPVLFFMMIWVISGMSYLIVKLEGIYPLGSATAVGIYLVVFVLGWIGQFIGHKIEGKKPSFLQNVKFLLIGPIWLLHFLCDKVGIKY